jgi:plastocyanin
VTAVRIPSTTVLVGVALLAGACGGGGHHDDGNTPVEPGARKIPVAAKSFAYDPEEITVEAGEDVAIVLTSDDIFHDFVVEKGGGHVVGAEGGETARGGLRVDKSGTYTFYCSVSGHRAAGMEGTLVVEE